MNPIERADMVRLMAKELAESVGAFEGVKYAMNAEAGLPPTRLDPRGGYEIGANAPHTKAGIARQIAHMRNCLLALETEL